MKLTVYCDGLYEPRYRDDGWACWAWVAVDEAGAEIAAASGCLGRGRERVTSNMAEYHAVGRALAWLKQQGHAAEVKTDSQLVVNQALGKWECNAERLLRLCARVQTLLSELPGVTLSWIPRAENVRADALANAAYEQARKGKAA